jgi:hypothetical protein
MIKEELRKELFKVALEKGCNTKEYLQILKRIIREEQKEIKPIEDYEVKIIKPEATKEEKPKKKGRKPKE